MNLLNSPQPQQPQGGVQVPPNIYAQPAQLGAGSQASAQQQPLTVSNGQARDVYSPPQAGIQISSGSQSARPITGVRGTSTYLAGSQVARPGYSTSGLVQPGTTISSSQGVVGQSLVQPGTAVTKIQGSPSSTVVNTAGTYPATRIQSYPQGQNNYSYVQGQAGANLGSR